MRSFAGRAFDMRTFQEKNGHCSEALRVQITLETLYPNEPSALRGNSKVLLEQVEPERLPVTTVDMELIADSCSSIIVAVCSNCMYSWPLLRILCSRCEGSMFSEGCQ